LTLLKNFLPPKFFIFERRAIRSNLLGKREFFLGGARLGRLANKGDPPTPNGAVQQVALPNQDIKMEAQCYAALMSKKKQSHKNSSARMIWYTFSIYTSSLSYSIKMEEMP